MLRIRGVSGRIISAIFGVSRSTLYYDSRRSDDAERNEIRRLAFMHKRIGYRMILFRMRRAGWHINHKKVYRIYREEGLKIRQKLKKKRYKGEQKPLPVPEIPDHTWSGDFVHETLHGGRKVRIFVSVDQCSREIPMLYADCSISGERLRRELEIFGEKNRLPENFVFDNGPEFRSRTMEEWAKEHGVDLHFTEPGKPTQNAFVESLNGKLRNELLNQNWFYTLDELREALEKWRIEYNTERPHSSLDYRTPEEYKNGLVLNMKPGKTNI